MRSRRDGPLLWHYGLIQFLARAQLRLSPYGSVATTTPIRLLPPASPCAGPDRPLVGCSMIVGLADPGERSDRLPDLFGIRHHRAVVAASAPATGCASRICRTSIRIPSTGLKLKVPVAEFIPDKVVQRLGGKVKQLAMACSVLSAAAAICSVSTGQQRQPHGGDIDIAVLTV